MAACDPGLTPDMANHDGLDCPPMATSTSSNKLECPSCGAPLRWKGEAPVVACRYCDTHVHTPTGQVTREPAVVRSQPKSSAGCTVLAVIVGVNLMVGAIALVASLATEGVGGVAGVSIDTLATISLEADNATIAAALGLAPDDDGDDLHIPLRGSDFDYAFLRWDDGYPDHVASIGFYATDGHPDPATLLATLDHSLGRRLEPETDGYRYWRWAGSHANVSIDGSHLGAHSDPESDSHWAYRTRLLWSVVLAAASGRPLELEPATRKAWLAHGYSLGELGAMDLGQDVDSAAVYMASTFPGSHAEAFISLDVEVPLSHPWFGAAELSWENEPNGPLETTRLSPIPGAQTFPDQAAIRRCLDAAMGPGEHRVDDHLAGTWSMSWERPGETWAHLSRYALNIHHGQDRRTPPAWRRFIASLEACAQQ